MRKITKHITLLLIITLILAFTGCAEFNINGKITPDNRVSFSYTLKFTDVDKEEDLNYEQLELFLLDVQHHWEKNGVDAEMNMFDDGMELVGTMEKKCKTREEAFNTLYEYMTNEITVFDDVSLTYNEDYNKAYYALKYNIDLTGIVDEQIYEIHPEIVTEDVDEFINNLSCNITFSLPYNDSPDSTEIIQKESSIDFTGMASIDISGIINNNEMMQKEKRLLSEKDILEAEIAKYRLWTIIAGGLLVLVIVAMIFVNIKSKKTGQKPVEKLEENTEEK